MKSHEIRVDGIICDHWHKDYGDLLRHPSRCHRLPNNLNLAIPGPMGVPSRPAPGRPNLASAPAALSRTSRWWLTHGRHPHSTALRIRYSTRAPTRAGRRQQRGWGHRLESGLQSRCSVPPSSCRAATGGSSLGLGHLGWSRSTASSHLSAAGE